MSEPEPSAKAAATTGSAPDTNLVGSQVGKYRLVRIIGKGGMGAVYEAVHDTLGQRIAIKVLKPELCSDTRHVQRFFDEARAVSIVQHPGIIKVHDFGHMPSGVAYMMMELLEGETLHERIARAQQTQQRMELIDVLRIARQLGSTLEAVHAKGIAHRDLKPANVFLVPEREAPSGERTKILDFGIAKFYDSTKAGDDTPSDPAHQLTTVGKLLGTPAYMSPEQCSGAEHIDDSIDVYALGVMLYQMLAGRLPFEAQHAVLIMTKHITEAPPPLSPVELSLPPPLCELVHEMLAKDRRDRPNMAQVVVRIEQLLESELGASSHQWRSQHRRRWLASRNFRRIALGALVVLSSVILIVIGQQRRSQRHARGTIEPPASMPAVPSLPEPASPVATPKGSESPTAPGAANPASAMSKPAKKNATATADSAAKERPSRKKSKEPKNTKGDFEISAWK